MLADMPDQKVYLREANALTVTFAMIETRTALDNLEAIAATPGIDGLFLGPADLSIALSNGANVDPMAGEVDRELDRITAAAHKAGKIMGAYCHNAERAVALAKRGVRFLAVGSDMGFLRAGAAAALAKRSSRDLFERDLQLHRAVDRIPVGRLSGLTVEIGRDRFEPAVGRDDVAQERRIPLRPARRSRGGRGRAAGWPLRSRRSGPGRKD